MKNGILNELIAVMKERVPQGQNLASVLADILFMGKEAVYRRLRGEMFLFYRRNSYYIFQIRNFYRPSCW